MIKSHEKAIDAMNAFELIAAGSVLEAANDQLLSGDYDRGGLWLACFGQLLGRKLKPIRPEQIPLYIGYIKSQAQIKLGERMGEAEDQAAAGAPVAAERAVKVVPALVLDLDGTVRRSKSNPTGFIKGPDDVELMPGIEPLLRSFHHNGYLIVGVTNQGGIASGYKTIEQARAENDAMRALFKEDVFHVIEMCPSMSPHEGGTVYPYNYRSLLRKPHPGMLAVIEKLMAENDVVIDWSESLMVGDRPEDEQCAKNAGLQYLHIRAFINYKFPETLAPSTDEPAEEPQPEV